MGDLFEGLLFVAFCFLVLFLLFGGPHACDHFVQQTGW